MSDYRRDFHTIVYHNEKIFKKFHTYVYNFTNLLYLCRRYE